MRATKKKALKRLKLAIKIAALALLLLPLIALGTSARSSKYDIAWSGAVTATAYNSMESQTDSTPWITASGTRCREGVIASNFLPFGTKVLIEGFGDRVFVVEDRMNRRYKQRIDIWFRDYSDARRFGVRTIKYHVLMASTTPRAKTPN
jgi:3D (Asp-Asp-Asp) domain-containing protein